jgi:hypothetical protein
MRQLWDSVEDPIALCVDSHKWDGSVSKEALLYEHALWKSLIKSDLIAGLLRQQLRNTYRWDLPDGSFGFSIEGRRNTGDANTGTGNDIINSRILCEILRKLRVRGAFMVQGDDAFLIIPKSAYLRAMNEVTDIYRDHGFFCEVETVAWVVEQISFCHMHSCETISGSIRSVKDVDEVAKDLRTVKNLDTHTQPSYWYTRASASQMIWTGVPVFESLSANMTKQMENLGGTFKKTLLDRYYTKLALKSKDRNMAPVSPVSFALTQAKLPSMVSFLDSYYQDCIFTFDPGGKAVLGRGLW